MTGDGFGILHLDSTQVVDSAANSGWLDHPVNVVFLSVALLLAVAATPSIVRLFPDLNSCLFKIHGPAAFEHSMQKSRSRNLAAICLLPAIAALIDRLSLYSPSFLSFITPAWSVLAAAILPPLFIFIRTSSVNFIKDKRLRGDDFAALENNIISVYLFATAIFLPVQALLLVMGVGDGIVRATVSAVATATYLISVFRSGEILTAHYGFFGMLPRLLVTDLIPAAIFVVPALLW